jgi:hypothetical protein
MVKGKSTRDINMTPETAYYICFNANKIIKEHEEIILKSGYWSYKYARNIIKGRWLIAEDLICDHHALSFDYAVHVIKGRFEKGEKAISLRFEYAYPYAVDVLNGPFPQCHPYIFDSENKEDYIDFLKSINYDLNEISEWLI